MPQCHTFMKTIQPWLILLAGVSSTQCKTTSSPAGGGGTSNIASLAALQANSRAAACVGDANDSEFREHFETHWEAGGFEMHPGFKEMIAIPMAAVPVALMDRYFMLGGRITLDTNTMIACDERKGSAGGAVEMVDDEGKHAGCVYFGADKNRITVPQIYVQVLENTLDEQQVQLSRVVQGFAMVFASFFSHLEVAEGREGDISAYKLNRGDNAMAEARKKLRVALLQDVAALSLSPDTVSQWDEDTVLAQLLDSALCNDTTRALIAAPGDDALFKESGRIFRTDVVGQLGSIMKSKTLADLAITESAQVRPSQPTDPFGDAPEALEGSTEHTAFGDNFPILARIFSAPIAVVEYFRDNRPIRTWFQEHRPVRRFAAAIGEGGRQILSRIGQGLRRVFPGDRCWRLRRRLC